VKVLDYAQSLWPEVLEDEELYLRMHLGICVIESAMVLVEGPQQTNDPVLIPWVRVLREEAKAKVSDSTAYSSHEFYAIDFVHVDFLESFVQEKLLPFAHEFFQRASEVAQALRRGGTVDDVNAWSWGKAIRPNS
jgi:hypothetical protein